MHGSSSFIMHDDAGTHSMQALLDHMTDYNAAGINIQALSMVPFIHLWGMTTEDERRAMKNQSPVHSWNTRNWMKHVVVQQQHWHRPINSSTQACIQDSYPQSASNGTSLAPMRK